MTNPIWLNAVRGSAGARSYATILQDDYGASEVWPLVDIASGTAISAFVNSARNGTSQGWDLQNTAGPVTGTLAPYSDGANDYGDIYSSNGSTGLADIFNGSEGSWSAWIKVTNAGVWTDGTVRRFLRIFSDSSNSLTMTRSSTNGRLTMTYQAGGTSSSVNISSLSSTDWIHIGVSWSLSNNQFRVFQNGAEVTGSPVTGLGTWSGSGLVSAQTVIGAASTVPGSVWDGWLAYNALKAGSIWTPAQFLSQYNDASTAGAD